MPILSRAWRRDVVPHHILAIQDAHRETEFETNNESAVKNVIWQGETAMQFLEIKSKSEKKAKAIMCRPLQQTAVQSNAMQRYYNAAPNTAECNNQM